MMKWLRLAALMTCLLLCAAVAEEAADNVVIYFQDGSMVMLPAEIAADDQKLADYCSRYFPGRLYARDEKAATAAYDAVVSQKWAAEQLGEGATAMFADLVKLGVYTSVVTNPAGEELTVPTAELTIRGFEDQEHHIAVVSAPRTGKASLREEPVGNGKVLANCAAGRIVAILEYTGGTYTKILYDDAEGYIRTDCLVFQDTAKAPEGKGTVHIKDTVNGKSSVTIRNTPSQSSSKVASVPTGTVLDIRGEDGAWYIVEGEGWLGYIQEQYLKFDQE